MRKSVKIRFSQPVFDKTERDYVAQVFNQQQITNGGFVNRFEEEFAEFCGGGVALAVSSCTSGLHLAMLALGIGPGDEVIVPALTHAATAHAVELAGAKPIFVDSEPKTGSVDVERIRASITGKTKAVIVVHYLGRPVDIASIRWDLEREGIRIVEDCALSMGAELWGKHVGLHGDVGCFSFYPSKHMTTGEGGMLLTRHPSLHEEMRQRREYGKVDLGDRAYDMVSLGGNFRMTEFQAAIGVAQLQKFPDFLKRRKSNAVALWGHLKGHRRLDTDEGSQYAVGMMVAADKRDGVREFMRGNLVETSIYYPTPVPALTYYTKKYGVQPMPVAERISKETVTLPVGQHLSNGAMRSIAEAFKRAVIR